jgi:4-hydroxy-4-methyl-2-oxoglutarate aldolase
VQPSTLERLRVADGAAVSDALDRLGLDGVIDGITSLALPARAVGTAVTVRLVPADGEPGERHLATAAVDQAGPGDVIVVAYGGPPDVATWGDNLHMAARRRSVAGVILDGATRDADEIRGSDPPLFARGVTPRSARGRLREDGWNVPVTVGGASVRPGDLVLADGGGIVVVPAERADDVLAAVDDILAGERRLAERLRDGAAASEVLGARYERELET